MRRALNEDEFYAEAAKWVGVQDTKRVKEYWSAFVETITRELFFCGSCKAPGLGTFGCRHMPETVQKRHDVDGKELYYYFPEHDLPTFKPDDSFINDINMNGVTAKYRSRLKSHQLNQKDKDRITRKEALELMKHLGKTVRANERSFAVDEFEEVLRQKKEQHERKKADEQKPE